MSISILDQNRLISEYEVVREDYRDFARSLAGLIENLLAHKKIKIGPVSYRGKDAFSFAGKLRRPDKSYRNLADITDLAGVRITAYFAEDVDVIAKMLRSEFRIDEKYSIDKRKYTNPNQFGYQSLHYVLSFKANRGSLSEYRKFSEFKCEVQVRSILQHAWAEIEHDLGYKSSSGVPAPLRRKFARIAGLLELADEEFSSIRRNLVKYESEVPARIKLTPEKVGLDLPSFRALYTVPSALTSLDDVVIKAAQGVLESSEMDQLEDIVEYMTSFEIKTIDQIEKLALRELKTVSEFVVYWLEDKTIGKVSTGIGAFYLLFILAWRTQDRSRILEYFNQAELGRSEDREGYADRLLKFRSS